MGLKEDIKELETSKEDFNKQLLEQRDETAELTVKLKTEIDSGNKLKILSKERQDEITRLNESRELLETIVEEKERKISCLKEDIKELETSKEGFGKQSQQQRVETAKITLNLKTEIDLSNKVKILSKERQDEIKMLYEMVELLEARAGENENELICNTQTISCLKEDIKELETSKEDFDKQLLHQRAETSELTLKLNTVIESGNNLKILSKENQDEIIRLNESRDLLEASIEEKEKELIFSIQTISSLKEDIKHYKMNHDCDLIKIEEVNHNLTCVKDDLSSSHNQITILTNEIECKIDVQEKLKLINIQNEDEIHRLEDTLSITRIDLEGNQLERKLLDDRVSNIREELQKKVISLQAELKLKSEKLDNRNHELNSMKHQFDQLIEKSSDSSDKIIVLEEAKKEKKKVLLMNKLLNTSIDSMK